jgi:hypothetical protein
VIWFVDPAAGSDGSGTLASPFNTLASADAVNSASTPIFVLSGSTGGIALEAGETLIGQGVTGSDFDTLFGITPPAGTIARPAINGTAPVLAGAVSLAGDTTLRGVAIAPASGTIGLSAQSATGIVVGEVSVTTSAATAVSLLDVDGTFDFSSVSADGATNGIMLSNVGPTGSVTISGGTIQNSTDDGIVASDVEDLSLAGMTVSNSGGDGIVVEAVAGGTSSVDVTNSSISDSVLTGVQLFTFDTSNAQVTVTGTAFHSNNIGVDLVAFGGQSTFTIDGNTFTEQGHNAINIFTDATTTAATTMIGTISNNVIGGAGAGSGSVLGTGIGFDLRGGADGIVLMENNSISNTTLQGIIAETRLGDGELDLTLIGNTIGAPEDPFGAVDGIRVTSRNARTTCLDATGNTSAGINGGAGISLRQANSAVFALDGYLGAAGDTTAIAAYLASQNTATVSVQTSGSGTIVNYTNETCSTP